MADDAQFKHMAQKMRTDVGYLVSRWDSSHFGHPLNVVGQLYWAHQALVSLSDSERKALDSQTMLRLVRIWMQTYEREHKRRAKIRAVSNAATQAGDVREREGE
jgi:hypothetical protein